MIHANTDEAWLPLYEALASPVRLSIINLLAGSLMNVKELAESLGLSSAIVTMHVRKLEKAGLVQTKMVRKQGGTHKMCMLAERSVSIELPAHAGDSLKVHEVSVPVGHYTQFEVFPTCGIATTEKMVGQFDDPRFFLEPERMNAGILWFGKGYVEYKVPNYLLAKQRPVALEIAMELGSEAPGVNDNWPSDISFALNGAEIGMWTSPGDYGEVRGRFSPVWWHDRVNQYGLLKVIRIQEDGSYIDGQRMSGVGIGDIGLARNHWTFRIGVKEDAVHVGGLTLYGKGFGNYNHDMVFRVFYEDSPNG
ncbi:ArsR/SmtB family transcription factor [Paenibacillus arenilitoris]|uniref:ArsR family transcriptional regulator n=1 Tax=Paenibacillus arenilitoris TaxID=2772299 RepID=A0A927CQ02_9BACL|nr:ArsR family transcriptional regulator [Paenibacillus arenilitoris]MBD2872083.1 ArsR family transcriptional regulator [Paenibacillus arenilitoris]